MMFPSKIKEKECRACLSILPIGRFPKHKNMVDGHLNKCKDCCNEYARNLRFNRKTDINWRIKERKRLREKARKDRENGKCQISSDKRKLYNKKYEENSHEKIYARVLAKKIPLKPCEVCGSMENIERHHEDYLKPLDITFLCRKHHNERHVEIRKQQLLNART